MAWRPKVLDRIAYGKKPREKTQYKRYKVNLEETIGKLYICKTYFDEVTEILGKKPEWVRMSINVEADNRRKAKNLFRVFEKRKRDESYEWTFGVSDFEGPMGGIRKLTEYGMLRFRVYTLRYYDIGLGEEKVYTQKNFKNDRKPDEAVSLEELFKKYELMWI